MCCVSVSSENLGHFPFRQNFHHLVKYTGNLLENGLPSYIFHFSARSIQFAQNVQFHFVGFCAVTLVFDLPMRLPFGTENEAVRLSGKKTLWHGTFLGIKIQTFWLNSKHPRR